MLKITQDRQDWNKQFETVWQPFAKKIVNTFSSEYPQKLKLIKSNLDLNNYINDIIKHHVKIWEIDKEDQAIWLEILEREHPIVGQVFYDILNIVKQIRDKRIEEEVNILIKKLTLQIDGYYEILESVIKGIKKH
ncbi:MAG: hypothetical protein IGQ45_05570 [Cyanobacterium sp. T60_A2020_053]|nr:hypothetical protein [Cyanobacterium sp. T60_A2020_053]